MSSEPCINEAQLLELIGGQLPPNDVARINRHLDGCRDCRELAAELARLASGNPSAEAPAAPARLERGASIGRYLVLDLMGLGAMGAVYAAFDPELERKVALKLLRPDIISDEAQRRFLREARAAARLAHPNVVAVHDVGTWNGQLFITMELVEGQTLRQWQQKSRPRAELLQAYLRAGEGLLAAHKAGLVHRDFKPDNVLVDSSGRVRVTDFGLARAVDTTAALVTGSGVESPLPPRSSRAESRDPRAPDADPPASEGSDAPARTKKTLEVSPAGSRTALTQTGAIIGTPAYMSPEQIDGREVDARSDQFSFCAALYEALHGEKPFEASSLAELRTAVQSGSFRPPPKGADVPEWLRKALLRGMSVDPAQRHPSLEALLSELGRARGWKRTAPWVAAALFVPAVVASAAVVRHLDDRATRCTGGEEKIATVWNPARKTALQTAFHAIGSEDAERALARVSARFDGYATAWANKHRELCEATRVHQVASEGQLEARMICLDARRAELAALVEQLSQADASTLKHATSAAGSMLSVAGCETVSAREAVLEDSSTRAEADTVDGHINRAFALYSLGQYAKAMDEAKSGVELSMKLGDGSRQAKALLVRGMVEQYLGESPKQSFHQAAALALKSGDEIEAGRAFLALGLMAGAQDREWEEALRWTDLADAMAERTHRSELLAMAAYNRGVFLGFSGDSRGAAEQLRRAAQFNEQAFGPDNVETARQLAMLAPFLANLGDLKEARSAFSRAEAIITQELGPNHPYLAVTLNNHGYTLQRAGHFDESRLKYQAALAVREQLFGKDHPRTALVLMNLGEVSHDRGDHPTAVKELRHAISVQRSAKSVALWEVVEATGYLTHSLAKLGKIEEALSVQTALVAEVKAAKGEKDGQFASALLSLARVQQAAGKEAQALKTALQSLAIAEAVTDAKETVTSAAQLAGELSLAVGKVEDAARYATRAETAAKTATSEAHPSYAAARQLTAAVALAKGQHADALTAAEQALTTWERYPGFEAQLARARLTLAQAVVAQGSAKDRVEVLVAKIAASAGAEESVKQQAAALQRNVVAGPSVP